MKKLERNYFKKIGALLLLLIGFTEATFTQITCNDLIRTRENIVLCQGDTVLFGDKIITSAGLYIQTFKTDVTNCDSIATLGVDYLNNSNFSFIEIITTNESYFFNGENLSQAGIYRDTFTDTRGCDSILTLTLQVIIEQENCDNGIDDDGDGLIDAFDDGCLCLLSNEPKNLVPNGDFEEKVGCCRGIGIADDFCVDNWMNLSETGFIYHNPDCWAVLGQELTKEGVTLQSGFVGGDILLQTIPSQQIGTELRGFSLGICLEEPMYAGNTYILSFDLGRSFQSFFNSRIPESMHFTINGITDCATLDTYQFTDDFCSKGLPYENLATVNLLNLAPAWNHFELSITPETTIEAIFLGGNCEDPPVERQRAYVFYDNISIVPENGLRIKNEINIIGDACQNDLTLSISNTDNFDIDWYKDSLPLPTISSRPFTFTSDITPTKNGTYHAKVTFEDGRCQLLGPLEIATFELNLPADTVICPDRNLLLSFAQTGVEYKWQDGSTQPLFFVNEAGIYWVEGQKGDCVIRDSINVSYAEQHSFLSNDTTICGKDSFLIIPPPSFEDIIWWENPLTGDSILVHETGIYHAILIDQSCAWVDSIEVSFGNVPKLDLGQDTILCENEFLILTIPVNNVQYEWQDGSKMQNFEVSKTDTYWAEITQDNCITRDSILVNFEPQPTLNLGNDTTLCTNSTLTLNAPILLNNYQWQDGTNNLTQFITESGTYSLEGTIGKCFVADNIQVTFEDCEPPQLCQAYLPNSFSPNGDGINDELQLLTDCELQFFQMEVYDRWGSLMFSTDDVRQVWDGRYKGDLLDTGVYLWTVEYQFVNQITPVLKMETITLVR